MPWKMVLLIIASGVALVASWAFIIAQGGGLK